jgi:NAD(P)-dependent dehydrogenase (short-subunit alcohol dehydrogenase family)
LNIPVGAPPIRGIVFAAGMDIAQPFVSQIDQDSWERVVNLELLGLARVIRLALPLLRRRGGVLVTVGSFGTHRFPPGDAISAVPKAAMEMLTRASAREEGRYGIRANTVAPGIIDEGLGKLVQERAFTKEIWDDQRRRVPLRRFGAAAEVADAVAFLASDRASYITGQTILVDGGLHI